MLEARALRQRIDALHPASANASLASRQLHLQRLQSLPLRDPRWQRLRALCLRAHGLELRVRQEQSLAHTLLLELEKSADPMPMASKQAVAVALRNAERALAEQAAPMKACKHGVDALPW